MNPASDKLLPRARFTGDQDGRVGGCDLNNTFQRLPDRVGLPDNPGERLEAPSLNRAVTQEGDLSGIGISPENLLCTGVSTDRLTCGTRKKGEDRNSHTPLSILQLIVARELDIRTVDTISVKSYDWQKQTEATVLKAPAPEVMGEDGEGVLIVDDLVDTGRTLELVRRLYPKAHFATVYAKPQGRSMVHTYITEVSQDTWIFFPWDMALQYVRPYRGE
jgi:hypothetical protein